MMYPGHGFTRAREFRLPKGTRKAEQHPLHGKLSTAIRVQLPSGEIKLMKVKEALRKGYITVNGQRSGKTAALQK